MLHKIISLVLGFGRARRYLEGAAIVVQLVFLLPCHAVPLLDLSGLGHMGKPKVLSKGKMAQGVSQGLGCRGSGFR